MRAHHKVFVVLGWLATVSLFLIIAVMAAYQLAYDKVILPRTSVAGVEISNMNKEEAKKRLALAFTTNPNLVQIVYRGQVLADTQTLLKKYDFNWAIETAWVLGRSGNPLTKISDRATMFFKTRAIDLPLEVDADSIEGIIGRVATKINTEVVPAKIRATEANEVKIEPGIDGLRVSEETLRKQIIASLSQPGLIQVEVATEVVSTAIDSNRINEALAIADKWKDKTLRLYYRDYSLEVPSEGVFKLIGLSAAPVNSDEVEKLLLTIKPKVEVEARNAVFNFDQGKVVEFSPEIDGAKLDEARFREKLSQTVLSAVTTDLLIPVLVTAPKIKAGDINNLGIKTLVGAGTSKFAHSIPNRIHNLTLASSRLNGALVAPGETFSLGQTIGEISRTTGYREAYVISGGRTILGDGGGVCQVSTTLFRAILNAGLPIVERKAHAYRVGYYEQDMGPGYDATVFFPSVDLKFINDTPGYLLIQTRVDAKNFSMRYEIYGTADGRTAEISGSRISAQTPPKATVYQDDPTLPKGTKKQIDWSAPGAKVSFDYRVTRGGEVLQDRTFYSTYQPWAAVYLVGTGELASR